MFDLTGKVAVVTGSSRGIGESIAHALARAGAKVVVSSRKLEACEAVASTIRKEKGEAVAIPCHIGKRQECEALARPIGFERRPREGATVLRPRDVRFKN